jgi:hypothetical protein
VYLSHSLEGSPADAYPAGRKDDADDKGSERLDPAVTVRMIGVGGSERNNHPEQHHGGRQDIASELHSRGEDRGRCDEQTHGDVQCGQHCARDNAHECNAPAGTDVRIQL